MINFLPVKMIDRPRNENQKKKKNFGTNPKWYERKISIALNYPWCMLIIV